MGAFPVRLQTEDVTLGSRCRVEVFPNSCMVFSGQREGERRRVSLHLTEARRASDDPSHTGLFESEAKSDRRELHSVSGGDRRHFR